MLQAWVGARSASSAHRTDLREPTSTADSAVAARAQSKGVVNQWPQAGEDQLGAVSVVVSSHDPDFGLNRAAAHGAGLEPQRTRADVIAAGDRRARQVHPPRTLPSAGMVAGSVCSVAERRWTLKPSRETRSRFRSIIPWPPGRTARRGRGPAATSQPCSARGRSRAVSRLRPAGTGEAWPTPRNRRGGR